MTRANLYIIVCVDKLTKITPEQKVNIEFIAYVAESHLKEPHVFIIHKHTQDTYSSLSQVMK